jgi:hypothetical protein
MNTDDQFNTLADGIINLRINQPKSKLFTLLLRIRNALKYILIGRL